MAPSPKIAIVGVGLIGGSIGIALKQRKLAAEVIGVGRRQTSLDQAESCGAVDRTTTDLAIGVAEADLVVVATPVASVVSDVIRVLAEAPASALVTDVGSTKASICYAVEESGDRSTRFVGSHPLAGDHRSGPEFARGDLLEEKVVVVTPTATTLKKTTERVVAFWASLGAKVELMSPKQHDQALATTSHLPHLVASALASATPAEWLPLAATGWADTTRIAAADPNLWAQIFAQNTPDVVAALDQFVAQLEVARAALVGGDSQKVEDLLNQAKRTRDALGN